MPQKAFPTAVGAGAYITGGRGGVVLHVDTLNDLEVNTDATHGSFLWCLRQPYPRIIVFDVGGIIDFRASQAGKHYLPYISGSQYGDLTIAGQTAPGGITILSEWFHFHQVPNVIWRYLRFDHQMGLKDNGDPLGQDTVTLNSPQQYFDHCTLTRGTDETLSISGDFPITDVTVSRCFMFNTSKGMILGGNSVIEGLGKEKHTVTENLFASSSHRFPNANSKNDAQYDVFNNVVYAHHNRIMVMAGSGDTNAENPNGYHTNEQDINWFKNYIKPAQPYVDLNGGTFPITRMNWIQEYSLEPDNVGIFSAGNVLETVREGAQVTSGTDISNDNDMWSNFDYDFTGDGSYEYSTLQKFNWFASPYQMHPLNNAETYPSGTGNSFANVPSASDTYTELVTNENVGANAYLGDNHIPVSWRLPSDQKFIDWTRDNLYPEYNGGSNQSVHGGAFDEHTTEYSGAPRPAGWSTEPDGIPDTWKTAKGLDVNTDYTTTVWTEQDGTGWGGYVGIEPYLNEINEPIVPVDTTAVSIDESDITINIPDTQQLNKTYTPINASNQTGVWSSSDDLVATVDSLTGLVTPVSVGSCVITYLANDNTLGTFSDICNVTVTNFVIPVTTVDVLPETASISTAPLQLTVDILPTNATYPEGTWSSSDDTIATVSQTGLVTPLDNGQVIISFVNDDSLVGDFSTITVTIPTGANVSSQVDSTFGDLKEVVSSGVIYDSSIEVPYDEGFEPLINGLHFPSLNIPIGKNITSARVEIACEKITGSSGIVDIDIFAEASNAPVIFTDSAFNLSGRTLTSSSSRWSPEDWTVPNQYYSTSDLSNVIQEVVDRVGYLPTDSINIIMKHVSGTNTRHGISYNNNPALAATLYVTYDEPTGNIPVSSVTITPISLSVELGDNTSTAVVEILPANASDKTGVWSSDDVNIVTTNKGSINTVSVGTTNVRFTSNDGGFTDTCEVTVISADVHPHTATVSPSTLTLNVGQSGNLSVQLTPVDSSDKTGTWTTDDANIISIISQDDTSVSIGAVGVGTTNITFTATDTTNGTITSTCVVTTIQQSSCITNGGLANDTGLKTWCWGDNITLPAGITDSFSNNELAMNVECDMNDIYIIGNRIHFDLDPLSPVASCGAEIYNKRAEIRTMPWSVQNPTGTEEWIGFNYKFEDDYVIDPTNNFLFYQHHQGVDGSPPWALNIFKAGFRSGNPAGEIFIDNKANTDAPTFYDIVATGVVPQSGQSIDVVMHVVHGTGTLGSLQVWIDGVSVYNKTGIATTYSDKDWGGNAKVGLYMYNWTTEAAVTASSNAGVTSIHTSMGALRIITRHSDDPNYLNDDYNTVFPSVESNAKKSGLKRII